MTLKDILPYSESSAFLCNQDKLLPATGENKCREPWQDIVRSKRSHSALNRISPSNPFPQNSENTS